MSLIITKTIYLFSHDFKEEVFNAAIHQMNLFPIGLWQQERYFYAKEYSKVYEEEVGGKLVVLGQDFHLIQDYIITDYLFKALCLQATDMHMVNNLIIFKKSRNTLTTLAITPKKLIEVKNFLKIFCNLDIINHQDDSGIIYVNFIGEIIGVRVSFFEGVSNLVNNNNVLISFRFLYDNYQEHKTYLCKNEHFRWLVENLTKAGLIVVAGKTGGGKTTFMYNLIHSLLEDKTLTIISAEDPIERIIPGIFQREVENDYETIIKSILRHNPDLIVVGEIRDKNTAAMCVRAVLTGHGVLCTIHLDTNNTLENFFHRFQEFGIPDKYLRPSVKGFVALLEDFHFHIIKVRE